MVSAELKKRMLYSILEMAEHFILQMGGFYPFGFQINTNEEISTVGGWMGEDFPDSQALIDFFEKGFTSELEDNKILLGATCIDVFICDTVGGIETKEDAIEIRLHTKNKDEKIQYTYSRIDENTVTFVKVKASLK